MTEETYLQQFDKHVLQKFHNSTRILQQCAVLQQCYSNPAAFPQVVMQQFYNSTGAVPRYSRSNLATILQQFHTSPTSVRQHFYSSLRKYETSKLSVTLPYCYKDKQVVYKKCCCVPYCCKDTIGQKHC